MRVLVLWADNASANMGVRVLAAGMGELARRAWGPDVHIEFQDFEAGESKVSFAGRALLKDAVFRHGHVKERIRGFDVLLDSGAGDSFTDIYGLKRLSYMAYVHYLAGRFDRKLVLGPQTIGPFRSVIGKRLARRSLAHAASVQARDSESANYAAELGRAVDVSATDVVFCLPHAPVTAQRDVILNVSGLLWNDNPHVPAEKYRHAVRKIILSLRGEGRQVAVMAHVIDNPSHDNDVPAVRGLEREFGGDIESVIPASLTDARAIIGSGRVLIGARMHACLNALSMGIPAVAMSYSRKFRPLLADLGWPHVVDIRRSDDLAGDVLASVGLLAESCDDTDRVVVNLRKEAAARIDRAVLGLREAVSPPSGDS